MIDVKKALTNPSAIFDKPEEVVETNDLSREQKIEILRRWEYDARELDAGSTMPENSKSPTKKVWLPQIRSPSF